MSHSPSILDCQKAKTEGRKISMLTCYDATMARLLNETEVDLLLVGDSVAQTVHGHDSTLPATVEMMALHTAAVRRGSSQKLIVADMPFMSFREGKVAALRAAGELMRAGAHAVKLEGLRGHEDAVEHLVGSGIPVMGHLGLTPQSVHQLGGHKVQGKNDIAAERILADALELERLGCFAVVLECVPSKLGAQVAAKLRIPVIGIGAGREVDGQVLVITDMLGLQPGFSPKFLRRFADGARLTTEAVSAFIGAIRAGSFPTDGESYS
jgi:3-methyl-2-oxobutanoate hydroxymethyltransferase